MQDILKIAEVPLTAPDFYKKFNRNITHIRQKLKEVGTSPMTTEENKITRTKESVLRKSSTK